jgi:hypothetical protein
MYFSLKCSCINLFGKLKLSLFTLKAMAWVWVFTTIKPVFASAFISSMGVDEKKDTREVLVDNSCAKLLNVPNINMANTTNLRFMFLLFFILE